MLEKLEAPLERAEFCKLKELVQPVILKSRQVNLICQLGAIYRKRELWQDAEHVLQQAIKLEPSQPEPYRSLGLLLLRRDDLPGDENLIRAKSALETSVRLERLNNERFPATHTLLGRTFFSLGDMERAQSEFRRALEIDPGYTEAKYNLAASLDVDGSPNEQSTNLLRQCVAEEPDYALALRDLGWQLRDSNLVEAEHYLVKALQNEPADVLAHIYYAQLNFDREPLIAEEHFRKAIALDPADGELHRLLGLFYKHHGRPEDANRELFAAIELDPSDEASITVYIDFLRANDAQVRQELYASVKRHSTLPDEAIRGLDARIACH